MSTSKLQRKTAKALADRFGDYEIIENSRPAWCYGYQGERLELDFLIEALNVAIEVQGAQHYQYTPHFHENYQAFEAQVKRDAAKLQRCEYYGVTLLEVYDDISLDDALTHIQGMMNERPIDRDKLPEREQAHWRRHMQKHLKNLQALYFMHLGLKPGQLKHEYGRLQDMLVKWIAKHGVGIISTLNENDQVHMFGLITILDIVLDDALQSQEADRLQRIKEHYTRRALERYQEYLRLSAVHEAVRDE